MLATSLRRGFAIVVATLATGCSPSPSPVVATPSPLGPLRPLAPPTAPFAPPAASAARKAKLIALAPKLDELFRSRLGEVGATGAGIAVGPCELDAPRWNDGKGQATFRLKCPERPLLLTLHFDPTTSLVKDVTSAPPREYGAVCAD